MYQKDRAIVYLIILAWISLAILIIFSPNEFIFDESIYYQNLNSKYLPFSSEFIKNYKGTAGIITTWFHLLIYNITGGDIIKMRMTNLFWLFLTALLLNKSIKDEENKVKTYLGFALILSPYIYQMTVRVMGDYPVFFFAFSFYALFTKLDKLNNSWYWYLLTGCIGSVAIAGKQTFILLLVFPIYSLITNEGNFWKTIMLLICSCLLPSYFFWIWGGILPKSSSFKYNYDGIAYIDFVYVFTYIASVGLVFYDYYLKKFITPKFYVGMLSVILLHATFGVIIPFPEFTSNLHIIPFFKVINYIWSITIMFLAFTGVLFFYSCLNEVYKFHLPLIMFVSLWCLIFLKIPFFQGRYLALISPFLLLILLKAKKVNLTPNVALLGYIFNLFYTIIFYNFFHLRSVIKWILGSRLNVILFFSL